MPTPSYVSKHSSTCPSQHSMSVIVAARRADAAAELAEAEYEVLLAEERHREKIQLLKEQQRRDPECQRRELERLQAEKNKKESARARFEIYNKEVEHEFSIFSVDNHVREQHVSPQHVSLAPSWKTNNVSVTATSPDVSYLAHAIQDSTPLNRLPK